MKKYIAPIQVTTLRPIVLAWHTISYESLLASLSILSLQDGFQQRGFKRQKLSSKEKVKGIDKRKGQKERTVGNGGSGRRAGTDLGSHGGGDSGEPRGGGHQGALLPHPRPWGRQRLKRGSELLVGFCPSPTPL